MPLLEFDDEDVEAAARMIASENPSASDRVKIEQIWTQVRKALQKRQRLHARITAGSGYGGQGERSAPGGLRPVASGKPATEVERRLSREVLQGAHPSELEGATKFFEPAVQDAVFRIAEGARAKQKAGQALTEREQKLLKYKKDAATVRAGWAKDGDRVVGTIEGVEFWT